jgi:hypothetical protein
VQKELKGLRNEVSVRQRQAHGLGMAEIQAFLNSPDDNLPTIRERAMQCVAYDAMTRRSELIAVDVQDLQVLDDGTGRLLIRRSRPTGSGRACRLPIAPDRPVPQGLAPSGPNQRRSRVPSYHWTRNSDLRPQGERENRRPVEP